MAALHALFLLALCSIGFCLYCLFAVPLWLLTVDRILSRSGNLHRLLTGLFAVSFSFLLILVAGYIWATRPAAVFEMAFDFRPSADVQIHSSRTGALGDCAQMSLSFSAAPHTIDRILKSRFETSIQESNSESDGTFFFSRPIDSHETEELRYNQNTMDAQYLWALIE